MKHRFELFLTSCLTIPSIRPVAPQRVAVRWCDKEMIAVEIAKAAPIRSHTLILILLSYLACYLFSCFCEHFRHFNVPPALLSIESYPTRRVFHSSIFRSAECLSNALDALLCLYYLELFFDQPYVTFYFPPFNLMRGLCLNPPPGRLVWRLHSSSSFDRQGLYLVVLRSAGTYLMVKFSHLINTGVSHYLSFARFPFLWVFGISSLQYWAEMDLKKQVPPGLR